MSQEEEKTEIKKECLCQNKEFRSFLTIALGTFAGVYCALCLFVATHRAPMMMPPCPCQFMHHHGYFQNMKPKHFNHPGFEKAFKKDLHKDFDDKENRHD